MPVRSKWGLETAKSPNSSFPFFYLTLGLSGLVLGTWIRACQYGHTVIYVHSKIEPLLEVFSDLKTSMYLS